MAESYKFRLRGRNRKSCVAKIELPCINRGDLVPASKAPDPYRNWYECDHASKPLGDPVCSCKGCGPGCPGYETERETTPFAPVNVSWLGQGRRPWMFPVTVAIPHLNTLDQLKLAVEMWRNQTVTPFIQIVDTGSPVELMPELEKMRAEDLEIHFIRANGYNHSSAPVTAALDLSQTLCRTPHMLHTHADVFPMRRDFVEWMIGQCDEQTPVVGWQMSPRDNTAEWSECVSHTATMLHMPTVLQRGLWWTMERYYADRPEERKPSQGWPDTESPFLLAMRAAGVTPKLLGPEANYQRHQLTHDGISWADHARSFTGLKMAGSGDNWERSKVYMADAEREARERLVAWRAGKEQP